MRAWRLRWTFWVAARCASRRSSRPSSWRCRFSLGMAANSSGGPHRRLRVGRAAQTERPALVPHIIHSGLPGGVAGAADSPQPATRSEGSERWRRAIDEADGDEASRAQLLDRGRAAAAVGAADPGLSLDDVERESGGRWSASAVGAYERGFRNLSLPAPARAGARSTTCRWACCSARRSWRDGGRAQGRLVLDLVALAARARGGVGAALPALDHPRARRLQRPRPLDPPRRPAGHLLAAAHRRGHHARAARRRGARSSTGSDPTGS